MRSAVDDGVSVAREPDDDLRKLLLHVSADDAPRRELAREYGSERLRSAPQQIPNPHWSMTAEEIHVDGGKTLRKIHELTLHSACPGPRAVSPRSPSCPRALAVGGL